MASVTKLKAPKQNLQRRTHPKMCNSIDEFYAIYDEDGFMIGDQDRHRDYHVKMIVPKTLEDAEIIVSIYEQIYHGTYPYREMLDSSYIKKSFDNLNYFWGIFRIDECSPEAGTNVGCFTIVNDLETRTAYFRGLNVLPQFHKKVGVRELATSMCVHFLKKTMGRIDKWYIEARTAHNTVQYISRLAGCKTQALFLNKDYFLDKKESDCLQVAYWDRALETSRVVPEFIQPEILPFYYRALQMHDLLNAKQLEIDSKKFDNTNLDYQETFRIITQIRLLTTRDKYGYVSISIVDPRTSSYLTALHTESVKNIEKIKYNCSDTSVLIGLFLLLMKYADSHEIEYLEWQVSVSEGLFCKFLLEQDFKILGYIPAWIPSKNHTGMFEDAVVLAHIKGELEIKNIQLLPEGHELLDIITMSKLINQEYLILKDTEEIVNPTKIKIT